MNKSTAEIRQTFLGFFQNKGHQLVASSSLIPNNDSTLLFTNAGMVQFKDVFLGQSQIDNLRTTTVQRCVRAGGKHNDLENVGYTTRHHTFFEMLGNFSFGDYFKKEAIAYAWELLTGKNWFSLPAERLWITVYETDDEAYAIWANDIGVPREQIIRIGDNKGSAYASDNFWQMGDTGPCGPCSEIFYDHGDHIWGGPPGSQEEDGDRYIEIWNIVFMQFNRQPDGTLLPLLKPSVDTGMGLERIAAVLQHVHSNYEIDLFKNLIKATSEITHTTDLSNKSLYVIADHIRACAFLIADGVMPSHENRGYVLRRIIRRAVRHGNMLGMKEIFFFKLVQPLVEVMGEAAEELKLQKSRVETVLKAEEEQFTKTLERGLALLNGELAKLQGDMLDGETVFRLYDTFGFPVDLTAEVCRERHLKIDEAGFEKAMEKQRKRAREASDFGDDYGNNVIPLNSTSVFKGYNQLLLPAVVQSIYIDGVAVEEIKAGQKAVVVLNETPFYGESGGQVGDIGLLKGKNTEFKVHDTKKYGQAIFHIGNLMDGHLRVNDSIEAQVDELRRTRIRLNHSATHLLHAALRHILGKHVAQRGSLVDDKHLRFDFSHFQAMTHQEIRQIEESVNAQIRRNLDIKTEVMDINAATSKGAMALFGEKYSQHVRVLTIGDFSIELCGGTHAVRTGDIGLFHILAEFGTAAGVRRIEAVTGECALAQVYTQSNQLRDIEKLLQANSINLNNKVRWLVDHIRVLEKELQQRRDQQAIQESTSLSSKAINIKGAKLLVNDLINVESKMLRIMVENLKNQLGSAVIVLATVTEDKVSVIVGVTKDLTDRIKACDLIAELVRRAGGKGGGRPDIAQAGGINAQALKEALASVENWVNSRLS
ncbi:alanine--tRNA ligase [Pantoea sp. Nvir]|uniref:alanine--tRNA ligase n=1 Tax=Pantoea sp. Nvir TaxID=2576760 RepID=UPI001359F7A4|nr:alanine--tRNA ligase [Pantoea sp. Nvir]MXP66720.1 alanine--tRNA ligase [Pantoea sp. Nvir]CAJ0991033.1 Alanine--tRNA ligase [Pantoea sp. Nvir]